MVTAEEEEEEEEEEETLKAGVESGTVKMLTVKLMGLLHGLQEALVMGRKRGDDDALILKVQVFPVNKNFWIICLCSIQVVIWHGYEFLCR